MSYGYCPCKGVARSTPHIHMSYVYIHITPHLNLIPNAPPLHYRIHHPYPYHSHSHWVLRLILIRIGVCISYD